MQVPPYLFITSTKDRVGLEFLQGLLLHLLLIAGNLILGFEQKVKPMRFHQIFMLEVDGVVVLVEDLLLKSLFLV